MAQDVLKNKFLDFHKYTFQQISGTAIDTNFSHFNANIQFTCESSKKNIAFLDLDIALYNGRLESTVHVKPTDRHQYFHYSSSYPEHTKRFIVFSQTLPTSRSCSCENDFQDHCIQMRSWFLKRLLIIKLRK